jgi:hypothetical protein
MRPAKNERRRQLLLLDAGKDRDTSVTIPREIPTQSEQMRIGDIPVLKSRWVSPGTFLIQGEFTKPPGWDIATDEERMRYAVSHGAIVIVHDDVRATRVETGHR